MDPPTDSNLRRELGLFALIAYGVGDILGAGIYALVGKIAGIAGPASWVAFGVALLVASLTALSYAELGRRFPRSGGESFFCQQAFRSPSAALLIGWLVLCSGVVSLATVSRAFAGYLLELFGVGRSAPLESLSILLFIIVLGAINFRGIRQSSFTNVLCTFVEATGLLLVIVVGIAFIAGSKPAEASTVPPPATWPHWMAIGQAASVAFFAFIGFEDMVNVAEEVRSPERNMPIAIVAALVIAGTVYIAVVWVATAVVPPGELSSSQAPLLTVVQRAAPAIPAWLFSTIALFAVANTGLLNFVMASRLLYGMARQELVPDWLGHVHKGTNTPHWSIVAVLIAAIAVALSGTLTYLAGTTSALLLVVFLSVNVALVFIKKGNPHELSRFKVPIALPILAAVATIALIGFVPGTSLLSGAVVVAIGGVLVLIRLLRSRR